MGYETLKGSPLTLILVLITFFGSVVNTYHIRHHRDRFKRQQGAHLYLPGSYVTSGGEGPDAGPWSEWSEPSPCSRTCGGGVSTQHRQCQEGYNCQGPSKRHFSCNTQDCPDLGDFRAQQCSEFDTVPFEGTYYRWIPYTKAPNPCELNCMPKGERFYYRQRLQVADGTRCSEDSLDVCIEGNCYPVGCDMMLGSNQREDNCRVCGGDGSSCNTVSGLLDMQDLQVGYNDILLIPSSATNIRVWERTKSNNYLAIRNTTGHYYLNGNWRIDFPRSIECAGTTFHYSRSPQAFAAPDTITALGPTEEPLFIVLLYQDTNVGVNYEYSVPKGVQHGSETETYAWTFDEFAPCSATCGGGVQYRNVTCAGRRTLEPADRNLCDSSNEPEAARRCNEQPCEPQWVAKPWGKCSAPCGDNGTQTRQVVCEQVIANGVASIVDDQQCANVKKPPTEQPCNQGMICADWFIGPWKPCDHLCGEGKQTRQVKCYRKENHKIEVLDDENCAQEDKPESEKTCNVRPCEGLDWVTSSWSGCENKCGLANETRRVQCATAKGEVYPDDLCSNIPKPEDVRQCNASDTECNQLWYASQWSECSAKCGDGVQTRKVFCGEVTDEGVKKIDESKCDPSKKYDSMKNCTAEKDECEGEWFTGPWSDCSKECGGGTKTRKVVCMKDNVTVAATACDPAKIEFSTEDCNTDACTTDEVLSASVTKSMEETEETKGEDKSSPSAVTKAEKETEEPEKEKKDKEKEGKEGEEEGQGDYEEDFDTECEDGEWVDYEPEDEPTDEETTLAPEFYESGGSTIEAESTLVSEDFMVSDDSSAYTAAESQSSDLSSPETGSGETDSSKSSEMLSTDSLSSSSEGSGDHSETPSGTTSSDGLSTSGSEGTTSSEDLGSSSSVTEEESSPSGETESSLSMSSISDMLSSVVSTTFSSFFTTESTDESTTDISTITTDTETTDTETTDTPTTETDSTESFLTTIVSYTPTDESTSEFTTDVTSDSTTDSSTTETESESTNTEETSESSTTDGSTIEESPSPSGSTTEEGSSGSTEESEGSTTTDFTGSTTEIEASSDVSGLTTESSATSEEVSGSTSEESSGSSEASSESGGTTEAYSSTDMSEGSSVSTEISESETTSEFDIWSSSTEGDLWETTPVTEIFLRKMRKCRRRKKPDCKTSKYGCCIDQVTPAKGPFNKECPDVKTCNETTYGCCEDGVSVAKGKNFKGCPPTHCEQTLFGCCSDKKTPAEGTNKEGCPPPPPKCLKSKFGCCPDNVTAAKDATGKGCKREEKEEEGITTTLVPIEESGPCNESTYGCCPDGVGTARGEDYEGCDIFSENCTESYFGCCPDGTSAKGPNYKGCKMECESSAYGCCEDSITPAHGYNREGCCLITSYGCCPDNIIPAQGPNLEGCGCQYSPYGCCPDNSTAARGYNNEGCGCQYTEFGCCPDSYTPAAGPEYQGCQCHTFQFGCCPDGVTAAKGPHKLGCGCQDTEFGCCSDDQTPAKGPNYAGCGCDSTKYGCCLDGVQEASGENFEGCEEVLTKLQDSCTLAKERGSCRNYTVKWFFDMEYGGCSRFWYGGCDGNENRFKTRDECQEICVEPQGTDRCLLPKVAGPCEGYYPMWYYDTERQQCVQFVYGGCLGNNNRFETREECAELCVRDDSVDACEQPKEEGPCRGHYRRWYFNKETQTCEQFRYGGCKANNNNFPTEDACKQRCSEPGRKKDHCSLPRAQGTCSAKEPRWYYDSSEKRCMPFYYTGCEGNLNNFESREACEVDCPKDIVKDTCQLPAETGSCANYVERYYYDTQMKQCRPFYYGGCDGNDNNFLSVEACELRCSRPPPTEKPAPALGAPEESPFRTEFCFLPKDPGPCQDYVTRWHYDRSDGVCKQFIYGGCQGNSNNFNTAEECQQQCGPSQDLCILPVVVGPCSGEYEQWYYDQATDSCKTFKYGGCLGNDNRFSDQRSCESRCKRTPPAPVIPAPSYPTRSPLEPEQPYPIETSICYAPVDAGRCNESISLYYYDPSNQRCLPFVYTGCEGNANRFNSEEQCERQCGRFRGQDVCRLPKDTGPCRGYFIKHYYDPAYGKCAQFVYGGCEGNGNRFSSQEECEYICVTREEKKPPLVTNQTASAICRLPVDVGPCDGGYKQYYFDDARGECVPFIYGGCGGNFNNFKTFQACVEYCREFMAPTEPPINANVGPLAPQPPNDCQKFLDECSSLLCEYGWEEFVDEETACRRCRCHDPCRDVRCEEDTRCSVDLNVNRTADDDRNFIPVCRPVMKEGTCPQLSGEGARCDQECRDDADCSVDLKCCSTGCGTSCLAPYSPNFDIPAELVTTGYSSLPAYTQSPLQAGYYPPIVEEETFEPEVSAGEGDYATLKCSVRGNPNPDITWKKGNLIIDGSQPRFRILLDGVLQIITLHKTDSGVYLCIAKNNLGEVQREIKLDVTDGVPHPTSIMNDDKSDVVVALGSKAVLNCYAIGYPIPFVTWWKDSNLVPMHTNEFSGGTGGDFSLLIQSVQLSNLGVYTCQAYNGIGKATSWAVTVQALGPVYSTRPEDEQYMKYVIPPPEPSTTTTERPRFQRPVYVPRPIPTPEPYIPPAYEEPSPDITGNDIAPQIPLYAEPPRGYTVPVRTNLTSEKQHFPLGSDVSLNCNVEGYPVPQVQWYKDGQPIQQTSKLFISDNHVLYIRRIDQNDTGDYACEAVNQFSRSRSTLTINVQGLNLHPNCTDNPFFANCQLIVKAKYCTHKYYARFCCKSCTEAGLLPVYGPHLFTNDKQTALRSNLVRRK